MAGSVNKVILLGNLGQDPDIRTMQNGKKVCTFSIATSNSWKDKETGEKKEIRGREYKDEKRDESKDCGRKGVRNEKEKGKKEREKGK